MNVLVNLASVDHAVQHIRSLLKKGERTRVSSKSLPLTPHTYLDHSLMRMWLERPIRAPDRETDVFVCKPRVMYTYVRWRSRITYRMNVFNGYF